MRDHSPTDVHTRMRLMKAGGWEEGGRRRGVSCTDKKHAMKTNLPAVPAAAFTGRSAAAALSWWQSDGREEGRLQGVSPTDEKTQ